MEQVGFQIDLELIKKPDYVPPFERNMNGHQHHHYQQQQHLRPSSCGRIHDREWEPTTVNGRARPGLLSSVPTTTASGAPESTGVIRRVRSKPGITANSRAKMPTEKARPAKSRLPQVTKNVRPGSFRGTLKVPTTPSSPVPNQHQVRGLAYRQQNVLCDGANGVFGVYAETKYVYAVNSVGNSLAQASAAAAFFAR